MMAYLHCLFYRDCLYDHCTKSRPKIKINGWDSAVLFMKFTL